jgi:recombination protein RecT
MTQLATTNGNGRKNLAADVSDLRKQLQAKRESIFAAAAEHVKPERFIELVARSCIANPELIACTRVSLFESAAEAARLGLELGGVLGQAYLIPFRNKGILEAQLVPGYKGYKELAYRSGNVAIIDAGTVRMGDRFSYMRGTTQWIKHRPSDDAGGEWTHCWAFAKTALGESIVEVMSKARIEAHRDKFAKGWKRAGSVWIANPEAMGEKTCLHRVSRRLPLSSEAQTLVERGEYIDAGINPGIPNLESGDEPPTDDIDDLKRELSHDDDPFGDPLSSLPEEKSQRELEA